MKLYSTILKSCEDENVIEKSRFITNIIPCKTRDKAEKFFKEIKNKYKDATHNVPAMVLGDKFQVQWASDDGEPQGTAGAPIVQMLVSEGITNAAVVVTRYFGGIKLGTGGLVRAYTSCVKNAILSSGICDVEERICLDCRLDYKGFNKLSAMDFSDAVNIEDVRYMNNVYFKFFCKKNEEDTCINRIDSITFGEEWIVNRDTVYVEIPRTE